VKRLPLISILLVSAAICVLGWMAVDKLRGDSTGVELVDVGADVDRLIEQRGEVQRGPGLTRVPLDEERARTFFPTIDRPRDIYDPQTYFRNKPGFVAPRKFKEHPAGEWTIRFNAAGFRSDRELLETPPDLRVLVAGDSHSEGVVPTAENYCSLFEAQALEADPQRSVEVLNASRGGYMLYNYLGVLEKYAELDPQVFVMAVFGGNDFTETVPLYGYFEGESLEDSREGWGMKVARAKRAGPGSGQALVQGMHQEVLFHHSPRWRELALRASLAVTREVAKQCAERDIDFVLLYIPPAPDAQLQYCREGVEQVLEQFQLEPEDHGATEALADEYLDTMRAEGVQVVDLRPAFRAAEEPLYWKCDLHINTAGHRVTARELYRAIEELASE
jgi:lysophospholipase L1-like esterase